MPSKKGKKKKQKQKFIAHTQSNKKEKKKKKNQTQTKQHKQLYQHFIEITQSYYLSKQYKNKTKKK